MSKDVVLTVGLATLPITNVANISSPEPAWAKLRTVGRYGTIFVDMLPKAFFNGHSRMIIARYTTFVMSIDKTKGLTFNMSKAEVSVRRHLSRLSAAAKTKVGKESKLKLHESLSFRVALTAASTARGLIY